MQKQLTEGQLFQQQLIAEYDRETAERYEKFCLDYEPILPPKKRRYYSRNEVVEARSPKICSNCGELFSPKDGEKTRQFWLRKCCTVECSHSRSRSSNIELLEEYKQN